MTETEQNRLQEAHENSKPWYRWGPYLPERQWSTVREDYSSNGAAWDFFPHDHARSRAYRWGEDGLLGICDDQGFLCFALALWNEADPILKERLFGLANDEGNHGEDVKEYYFYLDNTPTHSYMRALYKYPQRAFPYEQLIAENGRRTRQDPEYELIDTGVFAENRYFDLLVEYAKAGPEDILIRISAANRGPDPAPLHLLPTLWFRNTWSWGQDPRRPTLAIADAVPGNGAGPVAGIAADHPILGAYRLYCEAAEELLFTENDTNLQRLYNVPNPAPYVKDAFDRYVVHGEQAAVNPLHVGTKAGALYRRTIPPGATATIRLRLTRGEDG